MHERLAFHVVVGLIVVKKILYAAVIDGEVLAGVGSADIQLE